MKYSPHNVRHRYHYLLSDKGAKKLGVYGCTAGWTTYPPRVLRPQPCQHQKQLDKATTAVVTSRFVFF